MEIPQFENVLKKFIEDVGGEELSCRKWLSAYFVIAGQFKNIDDAQVAVGYEMFVDYIRKFMEVSESDNIKPKTIIDFRAIREKLS